MMSHQKTKLITNEGEKMKQTLINSAWAFSPFAFILISALIKFN